MNIPNACHSCQGQLDYELQHTRKIQKTMHESEEIEATPKMSFFFNN